MTEALIGAVATILGAVVGAVLARYDILDKLRPGTRITNLVGTWEGRWKDLDDPEQSEHREIFNVTRQRGSKVSGHITVADDPDKVWSFDGNFSGRFLQLLYFPSSDAPNRFFLDYGCYFFEMQGDGSFDGYSVGFDWGSNSIGLSTHSLTPAR